MTTKKEKPIKPISYYGKKLYYVNDLLVAKEATIITKEPQFSFEDIEHDEDR